MPFTPVPTTSHWRSQSSFEISFKEFSAPWKGTKSPHVFEPEHQRDVTLIVGTFITSAPNEINDIVSSLTIFITRLGMRRSWSWC